MEGAAGRLVDVVLPWVVPEDHLVGRVGLFPAGGNLEPLDVTIRDPRRVDIGTRIFLVEPVVNNLPDRCQPLGILGVALTGGYR